MDKNTLSNYGWIVIAVLVLSVMIALATPFGEYIKAGVESTTAGLFDTSEKALNIVGMSATGKQPTKPLVNVRDDYEKFEGQTVNYQGNIRTLNNSCYTRIPVQAGEQWFIWYENISAYDYMSFGALRFEDSNKSKVGDVNLASQPHYNLNPESNVPGVFVTIPDGATYMCLNLKVETTGTYGGLRDFTNSAIIAKVNTSFNYSLAIFGDSITEINHTCDKNWVLHTINTLSANYYNCARSGRGYLANGGYSSSFSRLPENENDVDLIVLYGSFNDLSEGVEIGTALDVYVEGETNTLAACMNNTYSSLQEKYPNTKIAVIAPAPWNSTNPANTSSVASQYVDVMKEICENRGFYFLDLYRESGMTPWITEYKNQYYYNGDGCHPNDEGQKILASKIIPFIQSVLND